MSKATMNYLSNMEDETKEMFEKCIERYFANDFEEPKFNNVELVNRWFLIKVRELCEMLMSTKNRDLQKKIKKQLNKELELNGTKLINPAFRCKQIC